MIQVAAVCAVMAVVALVEFVWYRWAKHNRAAELHRRRVKQQVEWNPRRSA